MALRTDYKDDILDTSVNKKRVYNLIDQSGNVVMSGLSLEDVTVYSQNGDELSSSAVNEAFNNINNRNLKTYASVTQFGSLTSDTIFSVWEKMPMNSMLLCEATALTDPSWNFPVSSSTLVVRKVQNARGSIELYPKGKRTGNDTTYRMCLGDTSNGSNAPNGYWQKYCLYLELTGTLTAGTTTITLTDSAITTDSTFDFYTSIYGVSPTNVSVAAGSITLTFDAQKTDMNVEVRVM